MIEAEPGGAVLPTSLPVSGEDAIAGAFLDLDLAETAGATEPEDARAIVEAVRAVVRERFERARRGEVRPSPSGDRAVRDAHPKILGLCKAVVTVPPGVPAGLAHGVFRPGARYDAFVRFSNGASEIQPDAARDGRGMAIKLCKVDGARLPSEEQATQDFVLIDHPVFFVRDTHDYRELVEAIRAGSQRPFFVRFWPPRVRWRELWNVLRVQKKPASVLCQTFHSMTPLRLGPHVVKLRVRPLGRALPAPAEATAENRLAAALAAHLAKEPARFAIEVQVRKPDMPVEDATICWSARESPFEPVAELELPVQRPDTAARLAFGDRLSFSPWHGLAEHRPLGSLNRLRRIVYAAIAAERRGLNAQAVPPPFEPTGSEQV